jgi:uncharacterized protein
MSQSKFVWYELMTTDTAAASAFYSKVIGWSAKDAGMPGMTYTIFSAGDASVGGMMDLPDMVRQSGGGPSWIGYVGVDDVDASAAAVTKTGGAVYRQPDDIPGVGRFAIIADPQGAVLALFKAAGGMSRPDAADGPGHGRWHELHTQDNTAAFAFYSKLFGWKKGDALDMGPIGVYQLFNAGDEGLGGMMNNVPPAPPMPYWLYYFSVDSIEAAKKRVGAAGGEVLNGPHEVPGGAWIIQCLDPQGAMFALVGPRG